MDHAERDAIAHLDLEQGVLEGLNRAGDVALEDEVEFAQFPLLQALEEVLEGAPCARLGELCIALACLARLGDLPCGAVLLDHEEGVTGAWHRGQAEDLHRTRRQRLIDRVAVLIQHCAHAPVGIARDDGVTGAQRAALHEHGGHGAAPAVQVRLDSHALGILARIGAQIERRVSGEQDRLEQLVDAGALDSRHIDEHRLAAVLLRHETELGELAADLRGVGTLLVDLVDGHDDGHLSGLGMVECLDRLRLDAIIGGDDEHGDIRHLRAAGAHGGECLVARRIDEGDGTLCLAGVGDDLVGADVLGDPTGLASDDIRLADRVEQLGLAVVDVAHDGHDRRTRHEIALVALVLAEVEREGLEQFAILVLGRHHLDVEVEFATEELQCVVIDRLGRGDHLPELEEHGHEICRARIDLLREVGQARTTGKSHDLAIAAGQAHTADRRSLHVVEFLALGALGLATARRASAGLAEGTRRTAAATWATASAGTTGEATAGSATGRTTGTATEATAGCATGATGAATTGCATGTTGCTAGTTGCTTGTTGCATGCATRASTGPGNSRHARHHPRSGARNPRYGGSGATHAGVACEGVVARTRGRGSRSLSRSDIACEGVVARARTRRSRRTRGLVIVGRDLGRGRRRGCGRRGDGGRLRGGRVRQGRHRRCLDNRLDGDRRGLFRRRRSLLGCGRLLGGALGLGISRRRSRHGVLQLADDGRFNRG